MNTLLMRSLALLLIASATISQAQVPQLINYQGRVAVGTPPVNFDGSGLFKFALVNANGSTTYWSNNGSSTAGSEPTASVALTVTKGLYFVLLGDTSLANMTAVPTSVFTNSDVRLRVWFNDGTNGFQLLTPDQRVAAVGYAMMAGNVADGAINSAKLAPNLTLAGTTTGTFSGSGSAAFQTVTGTTQAAASNTNYLLTNAAASTVTLPGTPALGDVVRINGIGAGGWQVAPGAGQMISGAGFSVGAAGETWTPRPVSGVNGGWGPVASSADGSKLVAAAGQIYTSADFGVTWMARGNFGQWESLASSADGTKLVAVGWNTQVSISADSGVTWTNHDSVRDWGGVTCSADATKLAAYVKFGGQIYTSTDSGVTWVPRESNRDWRGICSSTDGMKLAAVVFEGQIYTSVDSGVTWTPRYLTNRFLDIASSADGSKLVAVGNTLTPVVSVDSGVTWVSTPGAFGCWNVASSADGTRLVATGGQIFTSTNSGGTWTARDSARSWSGVASSADGTRYFTCDNGGNLYTSSGAISGNPAAGAAGTASTLQYIGGNEWRAISESIADGVVTNAKLANPLITINTGSGLTGGGTVALGGSLTLSATGSGVTSITGGGGVTVSGATGAVTLGSTATSANTVGAIVARDGFGNFSAGTININGRINLASSLFLHTLGGTANFFGGLGAGNTSMTGGYNTFTGQYALQSNTSGNDNTGSGHYCMALNTTGAYNTGVGSETLSANTSGNSNAALGSGALSGNSIGSFNTAVGRLALRNSTTPSQNTALGALALNQNSSGANNIGIGYNGGYQLTTGSNNIAIGNQGVAAESATIRLGTPGTQTRAFIAGIRGVTTGGSGAIAVLVDANGQLGTVSSSRRYKEDISDMGDESARIAALRPVTFRYKKPYDNGEKPLQFGLIAEEVAEVFPELAVYNDEGKPETVKYQDLTPMLLNEVQKLRVEKEALAKKLAESDARLTRLESLILQSKKETEP